MTKYPVQYPTACSPQAWSTGAPLLLLRTMLGLEPLGDHLVVDPALPERDRPPRAARHPRPLGPDRRLRTRARRRRTQGGAGANQLGDAPRREAKTQRARPMKASAGAALTTLRRHRRWTGAGAGRFSAPRIPPSPMSTAARRPEKSAQAQSTPGRNLDDTPVAFPLWSSNQEPAPRKPWAAPDATEAPLSAAR